MIRYPAVMGALDLYTAKAACPRCREMFLLGGQIKFFAPDFGDLHGRSFMPGVAQPITAWVAAGVRTERVWDEQWWRVREPVDPDEVHILDEGYMQFTCSCGTRLMVVLQFRLGDGPTATFEGALLCDPFAADFIAQIDFADGEATLWTPGAGDPELLMEAVAAAPPQVRAAHLRAVLECHWRPLPEPPPGEPTCWTVVGGATRCEACGDTRERSTSTALTGRHHSFFGPTWTGGDLRKGMRVACDLGWLAEDVDRGPFTRLRHPVGPDRLTVIGLRSNCGCCCGAGWHAVVHHFTRDPDGLTLADITLRVVRRAEDLADVDFAETTWCTRDPHDRTAPPQWTWTRALALETVLHGLTH